MLIIRKLHCINSFNAELNRICHLLALLGAHLILHVSRIRFNTAYGVVPSVSDRLVCRLRGNLLNLHTGRSLTDSTITDAVLMQCDLMMSTELLETCRGF